MNRLRHETSPYLLQHADNPVHWWAWGPAALAEAAATGKPILLSVGYAACHWCHVMAHESFEDEATAAVMNAAFVCIKVDREERPDIDHLYMTALHGLGEQGGWPLTMFLTSVALPFWGGTYFPSEPRYGRPSFQQVLSGVAAAYRDDQAAIGQNVASLTALWARAAATSPGPVPSDAVLAQLAETLLRHTDPTHGGLRGAPKFPNPSLFRFLWQRGVRGADARLCEAVHLLLTRMTEGGIYDQLGGGYARYATDDIWLVPHFEKMLYDNAQLLELLANAHTAKPIALYRQAAEETVGWLLRDMRTAQSGDMAAFAASEDADSEGEEGRFYVWNEAEIDALLGPRAPAFKRAYDVDAAGNWEGATILRRTGIDDPAEFAAERACLLAARAQRIRPGRDDKVLADWNALTIAALVRAAGVFGRRDWLGIARATHRCLADHLRQPGGGYAHAWRDGRIAAAGLLEDQAAMARAVLALFAATGDATYLDESKFLVSFTFNQFGSDDGGCYQTSLDATDLPAADQARPRSAADQATPSGNGLLAEVLARLFHLTGDETYRQQCERVIGAFAGSPGGLAASPTLAAAADLLIHGGTIAIIGDSADPTVSALRTIAQAAADPGWAVLVNPPPSHPAHAAPARKTAAYLCRDGRCGLPIEDPMALSRVLSQARPWALPLDSAGV